ncbi:unnamed protein product [Amoebophrya sp. A120]|nr:unnamed protein product [Amoebophrya sp. A120]|eukprot:GSA120T00021074001.1
MHQQRQRNFGPSQHQQNWSQQPGADRRGQTPRVANGEYNQQHRPRASPGDPVPGSAMSRVPRGSPTGSVYGEMPRGSPTAGTPYGQSAYSRGENGGYSTSVRGGHGQYQGGQRYADQGRNASNQNAPRGSPTATDHHRSSPGLPSSLAPRGSPTATDHHLYRRTGQRTAMAAPSGGPSSHRVGGGGPHAPQNRYATPNPQVPQHQRNFVSGHHQSAQHARTPMSMQMQMPQGYRNPSSTTPAYGYPQHSGAPHRMMGQHHPDDGHMLSHQTPRTPMFERGNNMPGGSRTPMYYSNDGNLYPLRGGASGTTPGAAAYGAGFPPHDSSNGIMQNNSMQSYNQMRGAHMQPTPGEGHQGHNRQRDFNYRGHGPHFDGNGNDPTRSTCMSGIGIPTPRSHMPTPRGDVRQPHRMQDQRLHDPRRQDNSVILKDQNATHSKSRRPQFPRSAADRERDRSCSSNAGCYVNSNDEQENSIDMRMVLPDRSASTQQDEQVENTCSRSRAALADHGEDVKKNRSSRNCSVDQSQQQEQGQLPPGGPSQNTSRGASFLQKRQQLMQAHPQLSSAAGCNSSSLSAVGGEGGLPTSDFDQQDLLPPKLTAQVRKINEQRRKKQMENCGIAKLDTYQEWMKIDDQPHRMQLGSGRGEGLYQLVLDPANMQKYMMCPYCNDNVLYNSFPTMRAHLRQCEKMAVHRLRQDVWAGKVKDDKAASCCPEISDNPALEELKKKEIALVEKLVLPRELEENLKPTALEQQQIREKWEQVEKIDEDHANQRVAADGKGLLSGELEERRRGDKSRRGKQEQAEAAVPSASSSSAEKRGRYAKASRQLSHMENQQTDMSDNDSDDNLSCDNYERVVPGAVLEMEQAVRDATKDILARDERNRTMSGNGLPDEEETDKKIRQRKNAPPDLRQEERHQKINHPTVTAAGTRKKSVAEFEDAENEYEQNLEFRVMQHPKVIEKREQLRQRGMVDYEPVNLRRDAKDAILEEENEERRKRSLMEQEQIVRPRQAALKNWAKENAGKAVKCGDHFEITSKGVEQVGHCEKGEERKKIACGASPVLRTRGSGGESRPEEASAGKVVVGSLEPKESPSANYPVQQKRFRKQALSPQEFPEPPLKSEKTKDQVEGGTVKDKNEPARRYDEKLAPQTGTFALHAVDLGDERSKTAASAGGHGTGETDRRLNRDASEVEQDVKLASGSSRNPASSTRHDTGIVPTTASSRLGTRTATPPKIDPASTTQPKETPAQLPIPEKPAASGQTVTKKDLQNEPGAERAQEISGMQARKSATLQDQGLAPGEGQSVQLEEPTKSSSAAQFQNLQLSRKRKQLTPQTSNESNRPVPGVVASGQSGTAASGVPQQTGGQVSGTGPAGLPQTDTQLLPDVSKPAAKANPKAKARGKRKVAKKDGGGDHAIPEEEHSSKSAAPKQAATRSAGASTTTGAKERDRTSALMSALFNTNMTNGGKKNMNIFGSGTAGMAIGIKNAHSTNSLLRGPFKQHVDVAPKPDPPPSPPKVKKSVPMKRAAKREVAQQAEQVEAVALVPSGDVAAPPAAQPEKLELLLSPEEPPAKKPKVGRPKGSKNKKKPLPAQALNMDVDEDDVGSHDAQTGTARPKSTTASKAKATAAKSKPKAKPKAKGKAKAKPKAKNKAGGGGEASTAGTGNDSSAAEGSPVLPQEILVVPAPPVPSGTGLNGGDVPAASKVPASKEDEEIDDESPAGLQNPYAKSDSESSSEEEVVQEKQKEAAKKPEDVKSYDEGSFKPQSITYQNNALAVNQAPTASAPPQTKQQADVERVSGKPENRVVPAQVQPPQEAAQPQKHQIATKHTAIIPSIEAMVWVPSLVDRPKDGAKNHRSKENLPAQPQTKEEEKLLAKKVAAEQLVLQKELYRETERAKNRVRNFLRKCPPVTPRASSFDRNVIFNSPAPGRSRTTDAFVHARSLSPAISRSAAARQVISLNRRREELAEAMLQARKKKEQNRSAKEGATNELKLNTAAPRGGTAGQPQRQSIMERQTRQDREGIIRQQVVHHLAAAAPANPTSTIGNYNTVKKVNTLVVNQPKSALSTAQISTTTPKCGTGSSLNRWGNRRRSPVCRQCVHVQHLRHKSRRQHQNAAPGQQWPAHPLRTSAETTRQREGLNFRSCRCRCKSELLREEGCAVYFDRCNYVLHKYSSRQSHLFSNWTRNTIYLQRAFLSGRTFTLNRTDVPPCQVFAPVNQMNFCIAFNTRYHNENGLDLSW